MPPVFEDKILTRSTAETFSTRVSEIPTAICTLVPTFDKSTAITFLFCFLIFFLSFLFPIFQEGGSIGYLLTPNFGYLLGYLFYDLAIHVIGFYGYENKVENLKTSLSQGSGFFAWLSILFLAGFTPLPYKAFTIASGVVGFSLPVFIVVSLISRSLRFFIVAYLSYKFGDLFTEFMEKHGSKWFTIIGILIVIVLGIIFLIFKFNA